MQDYTTTQRRTIVGYRCPGARGLSPTPEGPNCEMEITEVDEPVSYIVSTGDDGFIAENDQKIPLRTNRLPLYEDNWQAGNPDDPNSAFRKSCNHFIEGNHPFTYDKLQFLLTRDDQSPFLYRDETFRTINITPFSVYWNYACQLCLRYIEPKE
ncbi:MAG: hypothetical protein JNN25_02085 [Candidatus Kapabacteria bacterium]|nr:hypothetical protein [Candidatus Kapabacteria bacterium]